jgi:homogentisate 1,2-dioxygenase
VIQGLAEGKTATDETAVMIDTFRPLLLAAPARAAEDPEYAWSWASAARGQVSPPAADQGPGF